MQLPPFKIYEAMPSLACEQQKRPDPEGRGAKNKRTGALILDPLTSTGAARAALTS